VLFLINPSDADVEARVTVANARATSATDLIEDTTATVRARAGGNALVEARIKPRTVRMLALD